MQRIMFVFVCLLIQSSAFSHVVDNSSRELYPVKQAQGKKLLQALNEASPIRKDGRVYHGYTNWYIHWDARWKNLPDGRCQVTAATTTISVKTTLPDLLSGTPDDMAIFRKYLNALILHEEGHRKNGLDAATTIDNTITRMPAMANCQLLESEMNRIGKEIIGLANKQDIEYDAATRHGCTQGACLIN